MPVNLTYHVRCFANSMILSVIRSSRPLWSRRINRQHCTVRLQENRVFIHILSQVTLTNLEVSKNQGDFTQRLKKNSTNKTSIYHFSSTDLKFERDLTLSLSFTSMKLKEMWTVSSKTDNQSFYGNTATAKHIASFSLCCKMTG